MTHVLATVLAALFGALLDRLAAWQTTRQHQANSLSLDRVRRRLDAERINEEIDKEVADEADLGLLVDRL
ncbi:MAG: hypothetical protein AB8B88_08415 [Devosiaceae bacterium]